MSRSLLLLLLRRCASLKGHLLGSLLLLKLALLAWKTGILWLELLLLSEALRLAREASILRLEWAAAEASGLRHQSALEASRLLLELLLLLLLLAILRLPRSGAVAAP